MIVPVPRDLYAVVGNPVGHSLSPAMMNAVFSSLHIPAVYIALQVDSFADDLDTLTRMGFSGLSVTIPHKGAAFRLAAEMDETARAIGAVNALKRERGRWVGRNTDWIGSTRALKQTTELDGKNVLVVGAGGAAKAVVYGLVKEGASVAVANRTVDRGIALAKQFPCEFIPLSELETLKAKRQFDVIVQCTSAGMAGMEPAPVFAASLFRPGMTVMDIVYRPLWTPFLTAAREAGCTIVDGVQMLLHQGVAQLEWWLGRPIPDENGVAVMRNALMEALRSGENP